jgi:hypothetical protein
MVMSSLKSMDRLEGKQGRYKNNIAKDDLNCWDSIFITN